MTRPQKTRSPAAFTADDLRLLAVAASLRAETCEENDDVRLAARWRALADKCRAHERVLATRGKR